MKKVIIYTLLIVASCAPLAATARIGVGVGTGKIAVDKPLKPGGTYTLPSLSVVNTGDVPASYGIETTFHADQEGSWPDAQWLTFYPQQFHLDPGKAQIVNVTLRLPVKAAPGDYFAFLEAYPIVDTGGPGASIGIAAATKLEFAIAPANIWQSMYYRLSAFITAWAPWSYVAMAIFAAALLMAVFRKFFAINIGIRKK